MGKYFSEQQHNRRKSDHSEEVRGVQVRMLNVIVIVVALFVTAALLVAAQRTADTYSKFEESSNRYVVCEQAANDVMEGSHHLTSQVRLYAVTGNPENLQAYCEEVESGRREQAVDSLTSQLHDDESAAAHLKQSLLYSEELKQRELYALKLLADGRHQSLDGYESMFDGIELSDEDAALSDEQKIELGTSLVFDEDYQNSVRLIEQNVKACKTDLISDIIQARDSGSESVYAMLQVLRVIATILSLTIIAMIALITVLILRPLQNYIAGIMNNRTLPLEGAFELRYLAQAYNIMFEDNHRARTQLMRKAQRDSLTNLYNRGVFEAELATRREYPVALLLIDIDDFKSVNDTNGHDVGDGILRKLADLMRSEFRLSDYPCRIGGDEFAVIMVDASPNLKPVIAQKIQGLRDGMLDVSDGLPPATISVGVVFGEANTDSAELYKRADKVLYQVKDAGRDGYAFE